LSDQIFQLSFREQRVADSVESLQKKQKKQQQQQPQQLLVAPCMRS
jgi:hypothetical protein